MLKDATVVLSDDTPRDYVTLTRRRGYFKSRHAAKYVPLSKDELSAIRRAAAIKGNETRKQRPSSENVGKTCRASDNDTGLNMSTKIEWAEETLNAIVGCRKCSPGCENCYAITTANIRGNHPNEKIRSKFAPTVSGSSGKPNWTGQVTFNESVLLAAIKRKKPTVYFVNSLSDLFYDGVSDEIIDKHFAAFALAPQHRFLVLTKRADRMLEYFLEIHKRLPVRGQGVCTGGLPFCGCGHEAAPDRSHDSDVGYCDTEWPLRNVWLGTSVENQKYADERIPLLLQTPAAVRFLSVEPMLGAVGLRRISTMKFRGAEVLDSLTGTLEGMFGDPCPTHLPAVDWVICGGESGLNSRPFYVKYARDIRDQCKAAGVPFFLKQLGAMPIDEDGSILQLNNKKGGDIDEFPEDLRVREMPEN